MYKTCAKYWANVGKTIKYYDCISTPCHPLAYIFLNDNNCCSLSFFICFVVNLCNSFSLTLLIRLQLSLYNNILLLPTSLPLLELQIVPLYHLYEGIYLIMNSGNFFINLFMRSWQPNKLCFFQNNSLWNFISFSSHSISISHNLHTNSKNNVFQLRSQIQ